MEEIGHLPEHVSGCSDLALLKTLRVYERVYAQLAERNVPAPDGIRDQIGRAIRAIEEELKRRGRFAETLPGLTGPHHTRAGNHAGGYPA